MGVFRPTSDSPPRLRTIERDQPPIKDQWKEADIDILRVGSLTVSSQPSFCRFTYGPTGDQELFSLKHQIGKALALL